MTDFYPEVMVKELVDSLNKYEVKLIREELMQAGKRYRTALKLLEIIRSDRSHDLAEIRKKAEGEGVTHFHRTARLLKEWVTGHLKRQLLEEDSLENTVWHSRSKAKVLWRKGFKEEAISALRKGIDELALEDNPEHVLTLLITEQRMLRSADFNKRAERHTNNQSQRNAALKIIRNRDSINDLSEEAYQLRKLYHKATHPDIEEKVRKIINNPLLQSERAALSFTARIRFHMALSFCYSMLYDGEKTVYHHRQHVNTWEARPDQQKLKPRTYQQAIINYCAACVRFEQDVDIEHWYEKAESVEIKDKAEAAAGFYGLSNFRLFHLLNRAEPADGVAFARSVEQGMVKHRDFLDDEAMNGLIFNLAALMFLSDNAEESVRWYKQLVKRRSMERKDLQGVARMMIMLLSFDRDSTSYVDSMNKEARRYFKKHPEVDSLNGLVYEFIGKMISVAVAEEKEVLNVFLQRLDELVQHQGDVSGYEEVRVWVLSRISGKTFGQIWGERKVE